MLERHGVFYTSAIPEVTWYEQLYNKIHFSQMKVCCVFCFFFQLYIYIYVCIFKQHFFVNANFIKHNRHFMSTYFLLAESTRDTYNYGQYINQFSPNTIKVIREFKRIQKKICRHKMSIMFNEICIYIYILPYMLGRGLYQIIMWRASPRKLAEQRIKNEMTKWLVYQVFPIRKEKNQTSGFRKISIILLLILQFPSEQVSKTVRLNDWLIEFNGITNRLGLFYI